MKKCEEPPTPLPLRIHPVQRKRLYSQYIRINRALRPCGIDFAGSHVLDVILIPYPVIGRGGVVRHAVMDDDELRDHHTAQDDLPGLRHGLDFVLRYLGREVPVQGVVRYHDDLLFLFRGGQGIHLHGLERELPCQDLRAGYQHRLIVRGGDGDVVLGIGLYLVFRLQ